MYQMTLRMRLWIINFVQFGIKNWNADLHIIYQILFMKKLKCLAIILLIGNYFPLEKLSAQEIIFDPSLDSRCKEQPKPVIEKWNTCYMWYPGQLSALLQDRLQYKSKERATNVGYPDYFYEKEPVAYFQRKLKLKDSTTIKWAGSESIICFINGKSIDKSLREYTLSSGTTDLLFEVFDEKGLPCIIVNGLAGDTKYWEVSLDKTNWNAPESYAKYNSPSLRPDHIQETTFEIKPYKHILFNNSTSENNLLTIGKDGCVIVDFWYQEIGSVQLEVKGNGTLSFNVGESQEEALNSNTKFFEQNPISEFVLDGTTQEIIIPERAVRFLKIESTGQCVLNSIKFKAKIWPVEHLMTFESNDDRLNNIWKVASATMHTGMHDFYLDGIKRDGLPWAMDLIQSSLVGDYLFGDELISRNGLSIALLPKNPHRDKLQLVDFPLYALIGFKQNYLHYGDIQTSLLFKDRIIELLNLYESMQDENGFISGDGTEWGLLPSWATMLGPDKDEKSTYAQMLLYENFSIGAYFANRWGDKKLAREYNEKSVQLRENIIKHFWDKENKTFINGYYPNGEKDNRISHHAQFWGIYTGMFPDYAYKNLFENILPKMSYYQETYSIEKGYEYLSFAKANQVDKVMSIINNVWGDWVDKGFTRFPENIFPNAERQKQLSFYNRPFGMSLCHPCNGVPPIIAILHGILGFSQSDQKINEYYFKPNLVDLKWVDARIPVKEGFIGLHIDNENNCFIEIPENCSVNLLDFKTSKVKMEIDKAGKYEFKYR